VRPAGRCPQRRRAIPAARNVDTCTAADPGARRPSRSKRADPLMIVPAAERSRSRRFLHDAACSPCRNSCSSMKHRSGHDRVTIHVWSPPQPFLVGASNPAAAADCAVRPMSSLSNREMPHRAFDPHALDADEPRETSHRRSAGITDQETCRGCGIRTGASNPRHA
jgi:hypothetical protein